MSHSALLLIVLAGLATLLLVLPPIYRDASHNLRKAIGFALTLTPAIVLSAGLAWLVATSGVLPAARSAARNAKTFAHLPRGPLYPARPAPQGPDAPASTIAPDALVTVQPDAPSPG